MSDDDRMRQALALAERAIGLTDPNPRVGCVIADADARVVGQGHTQHAGGAHAEVMALRSARDAGHQVRGGTAWVTLEPCAHHGRTPPCCDALIAAGLARVVVAARDPFPQVAGRGIAAMRAAGIQVDMAASEHESATRELNIGFFSRLERGRPWIRAKVATTLDGRTALPDGRSQWITGPQAREDGHAWRKRASVIMTGIGTVLADDPRLDVRLVQTPRQPTRLVMDSSLRTPPTARVLQPPGSTMIAYDASSNPGPQVSANLEAPHVELLALASLTARERLQELVRHLTERQVNEVHVEAGSALNGSLIAAGLVDELLIYVAPSLMGEGRGVATLHPLPDLSALHRFEFVDVERVGADLRMRLRVRA